MQRRRPAEALIGVGRLTGKRLPARLVSDHSALGVVGPENALNRVYRGAEPLFALPQARLGPPLVGDVREPNIQAGGGFHRDGSKNAVDPLLTIGPLGCPRLSGLRHLHISVERPVDAFVRQLLQQPPAQQEVDLAPDRIRRRAVDVGPSKVFNFALGVTETGKPHESVDRAFFGRLKFRFASLKNRLPAGVSHRLIGAVHDGFDDFAFGFGPLARDAVVDEQQGAEAIVNNQRNIDQRADVASAKRGAGDVVLRRHGVLQDVFDPDNATGTQGL